MTVNIFNQGQRLGVEFELLGMWYVKADSFLDSRLFPEGGDDF